MSIGVQSIPELYTTLMGWDLYDKIWDLLTETGISFIPFIGMILKNVSSSYLDHHGTGKIALRQMEVQLISALLIIFFAAAPCIPLDVHSLSYAPICEKDKKYYPGDTGTTYDKTFSTLNNAKVPMWWYLVLSVSEGLTNASNTLVGCAPDLRKMITQVNMTQITDPEVKKELIDFENMCYLPAKTQYSQDKLNDNEEHLDVIKNDIDKFGVDDTEWIGSHSFNEVYYENLKSTRPIPGFPYEANEDINSQENKLTPPIYANPRCHDWWNDSENGLRAKTIQSLPLLFNDEFKDYINTESTQDNLVKRILSNVNGFQNANSTIGQGGYSSIIASLGIWYQQLEEYPKLYAASQAAPIIQAIILLMVYAFLPFALVFSSYRLANIILGAMLIFSVIFWGFIWHLVSWTDSTLMQALYTNWFAKQGAAATLADMIIASLIIFAPIFWFVFMGAVGIALGDVVSSLSLGMSRIGENAASKAATTLSKTAAKGGAALL